MNLTILIDQLKQQLQQPLPGHKAQMALFSKEALSDYEKRLEENYNSTTTRQSSVLILLYQKNEEVFMALIKRPEYDGVHSGQIALPGGKVEPGDKDIIATALRETQEEIGITSEHIHVLGTLTPVYIPPSRFWVNVVVGYMTSSPQFIADSREVASVIELPLEHLQDLSHINERSVLGGQTLKMKAPGFIYQNHFIWGATFMMLTEFRELIKQSNLNFSV
ncbi:MAG: pyrophosphohydrolase [Chitinophagaceae bacterium]|nr:pyrophosphohydrolase [Chitinophagaceae bacterium]